MGKPQAKRRYIPLKREGARFRDDTIWFLLIVGAAFLIRTIYLFEIEAIPFFYNLAGDGRSYDEWAQRIAGGDWLGQGVFYQTPLYPYFLGALQFVVGHNLWLIRFLQIILGAISCGLIFRIGERFYFALVSITDRRDC